jgi:hypothetical protein
MAISSLTLLFLSAVLTVCGLFPCLGWVNWVAIPLCVVTVFVGTMGLASDKDPATGRARGRAAHLLAVVFGLALGAVATLRWVIGAGIV